jgi:hypothetical protein
VSRLGRLLHHKSTDMRRRTCIRDMRVEATKTVDASPSKLAASFLGSRSRDWSNIGQSGAVHRLFLILSPLSA